MEKIQLDTLKSTCPKAWKAYVGWIKYVTSLEDDKEVELYADVILITTPRMIFDFFDLKGVYISITNTGGPDQWIMSTGVNSSVHADSRPEAEQKAFVEAFHILETKI